MPAIKKTSTIVTLRAKDTIALPPAHVGYHNMVDPDTMEEGKPRLTLNAHFGALAIPALTHILTEKVLCAASVEKLREEILKNAPEADSGSDAKKADWLKKVFPEHVLTAEEWLERALREPNPEKEHLPQFPFLKLVTPQTYLQTDRKTGEKKEIKRTISCWDHANHKLNLPRLRLGTGSVVEPIVYPNLYYIAANKATGAPALVAPSLRLVGVRVLELKQFGGGQSSAPDSADDDAIRSVMGADFHYADLSAFEGEEEHGDAHEGGEAKVPGADDAEGPMF